MSNSKKANPESAFGGERPVVMSVTMDDDQLNKIILPILGEVNSLRSRVAKLEEALGDDLR